MPRGKTVDAKTRDAILEAIDKGGKSRNQIAREFDLAGSTISNIATDNGRKFDTSQTELAVIAASIDSKMESVALAKLFLVRAREALEDMNTPMQLAQFDPGTMDRPGRWVTHTLDQPTPTDRRNLMVIAGVAVQRARDLMGQTTGSEIVEGTSLIGHLGAALTQYAENAAPADGGVDETDPRVLPQ